MFNLRLLFTEDPAKDLFDGAFLRAKVFIVPLRWTPTIFGSIYSRIDQVKFVEDGLLKILLRPF